MPIFWSWGRTDTLGSGNLFLEEPPRACLRVRPRRFSCRTDEAAIEGEASSAMWVGPTPHRRAHCSERCWARTLRYSPCARSFEFAVFTCSDPDIAAFHG